MRYIFEDSILDLLTRLEGEAWRRQQQTCGTNPHGFYAWRHAWDQKMQEVAKDPTWADEPVSSFLEGGDGAIYGEGGWHRYAVRADGEIVLLGWSAREPNQAKARELGFSVR